MTKSELLELLRDIKDDDAEVVINDNGNYYETLDVMEEDGKAVILVM